MTVKLALDHFLAIYQVDRADGLTCHYEILALYVLMSRYDEAQAFVNSCTSYAADVRMQVSLLVAAILGGYHADASQLLVGFCVQVTDFLAFCEQDIFPLGRVMEAETWEECSANCEESLYFAFSLILPLLLTASTYIQAYLNAYVTTNVADSDDDLDHLPFLSSKQLSVLALNGIYGIQNFQLLTETALLPCQLLEKPL